MSAAVGIVWGQEVGEPEPASEPASELPSILDLADCTPASLAALMAAVDGMPPHHRVVALQHALTAVGALLPTHVPKDETQRQRCLALSCCVDWVQAALDAHGSSITAIADRGLFLLRRACCISTDAVPALRLMPTVLTLLARYIDSSVRVAVQAVEALRNILFLCPTAPVLDQLPLVSRVAHLYPEDEEAIAAVCSVFRNLAFSDEHQRPLLACVPQVLGFLDKFPASARLAREAVGVLRNVGVDQANQVALLRVTDTVDAALDRWMVDPEIAFEAVGFYRNLSVTEDNGTRLVQSLPRALQAVAVHGSTLTVVEEALLLLWYLTAGPFVGAKLSTLLTALPVLVRARATFPGQDGELVGMCCLGICHNLALGNWQQLASMAPVILGTLDAYGANAEVRIWFEAPVPLAV